MPRTDDVPTSSVRTSWRAGISLRSVALRAGSGARVRRLGRLWRRAGSEALIQRLAVPLELLGLALHLLRRLALMVRGKRVLELLGRLRRRLVVLVPLAAPLRVVGRGQPQVAGGRAQQVEVGLHRLRGQVSLAR